MFASSSMKSAAVSKYSCVASDGVIEGFLLGVVLTWCFRARPPPRPRRRYRVSRQLGRGGRGRGRVKSKHLRVYWYHENASLLGSRYAVKPRVGRTVGWAEIAQRALAHRCRNVG